MPNLLHGCSDAFETYRKWVSSNPQTVGDLETTLKWASYFVAGRMSSSPVVSELTYSLSNLLVLFNDQLIAKSSRPSSKSSNSNYPSTNPCQQQRRLRQHNKHRIRLLLTTLEYCEVFIEMSAGQLWGETGRWFFVCCVQLAKCMFRMLLTWRYGDAMVRTPATQALNRKHVVALRASADEASAKGEQNDALTYGDCDEDSDSCDGGDVESLMENRDANMRENNQFGANVNASFELRRSGRIVRSVEGAPPVHLRTWKAPERRQTAAERMRARNGRRVPLAEYLYVFKPLVHLAGCGAFGLNSWRSFGLPLLMDACSLHLYNKHRAELSAHQRLELSRRNVQLLMYLVRSPVYDKFTRDRIASLLATVGRSVPLTATICTTLNDYIPHWQSIYFYMWSS